MPEILKFALVDHVWITYHAGDYPFSTYAKFSEKLHFLPLIRYVMGKNVSFLENVGYVLSEWSPGATIYFEIVNFLKNY